ncbi:MAG TPA: RluA family pseudouridine synthase [bacterium]|nr:RluA family pseudouridine synthase [bacterium]
MENEQLQEIIDAESDGLRLDVFLTNRLDGASRGDAQRLVESDLVTVDGKNRKSSYKLRVGELVLWHEPEPRLSELVPEPIAVTVVHADNDLIVVNKPEGMVVHPGCGHHIGTLIAGLLFRFPEVATVGGPDRPGIVHRLDKDTSGVMLVARSARAYQSLIKQFADRTIHKRYLAVCHGGLRTDHLTIDLPIGRSTTDRKKMAVRRDDSREAQTELEVIERAPGHTLVALHPRTGRTHQIRVHLNYIGHPIAGDPIYGARPTRRHERGNDAARLLLHAESITLTHPGSGEPVGYRVPPPPSFVSEWTRFCAANAT